MPTIMVMVTMAMMMMMIPYSDSESLKASLLKPAVFQRRFLGGWTAFAKVDQESMLIALERRSTLPTHRL